MNKQQMLNLAKFETLVEAIHFMEALNGWKFDDCTFSAMSYGTKQTVYWKGKTSLGLETDKACSAKITRDNNGYYKIG